MIAASKQVMITKSLILLQCLYYLAHDDDVMEKVCLLPQPVLASLIKYVLWLVECSHDSGRQWAVMFCGMITSFRVLLDTFDQQDGVRKLFNSVSKKNEITYFLQYFLAFSKELYFQSLIQMLWMLAFSSKLFVNRSL